MYERFLSIVKLSNWNPTKSNLFKPAHAPAKHGSSNYEFYRNFYDGKKNHERELTILQKCKETMPVSQKFRYFSGKFNFEQWVDYCVSLAEKEAFALWKTTLNIYLQSHVINKQVWISLDSRIANILWFTPYAAASSASAFCRTSFVSKIESPFTTYLSYII